jgi:hypothetical protein
MKPVYYSQEAVLNVVRTSVMDQRDLKKLLLLLFMMLLLTTAGIGQNYTFVRTIGTSGTGEGQFNSVKGIAIDASRNIYVTDYLNHRVQVFTADGVFIRQFGSHGHGNGQFYYPMAIVTDDAGNIYVGDGNGVQVFTNTGTFIHRLHTEFVSGLAMDEAGNIYIGQAFSIDVYNNALTQKIRTIGDYGQGAGQFDNCRDMKVDKKGRLFVADAFNERVQVFNNEGAYIGQFGTKGTGDGQFMYAEGLAIDGSGFIYVSDEGPNRVQVFDPETFALVRQFGTTGTGPHQFRAPLGIELDNVGNIYVTEYTNNRIQIFSKTPNTIQDFENVMKTYGDPDFALSASSDSQGQIGFSTVTDPANTGAITIHNTEAGSTASIVTAGTVTIRAYAPDDYRYSAATKDIQLTINKAAQTITFDPLEPLIMGEDNFVLSATTTSLLPVTFSSSDPGVATVEGDVVTIKSAGTAIITARQPGNENYQAAEIVEQVLVVDAITGTDPQAEAATEIFPLPANDLVTIRSRFVTPATRIMILDSFGRVMEELKPSSTEKNILQVSVKHLPAGMYFLQLNTPKTITQRLIKI